MGSNKITLTQQTSQTMFASFTNYFWGEVEEESPASPSVPRAQEVEDWIVVGGTPKDFKDKSENKSRQSPNSQRNSSKQRLQSLMFGDASSTKSGSNWNRSTMSGNKNQMYKQNFSIKMAGNRNLKQC